MAESPLRVSAVVCAYTEERWDDVRAAVGSLVVQSRRPDEVVLVVDHNPELARRAAERWARSRLVRVVTNDHRQGLSGARNTGLQHVTGDVVAFLDDDAAARLDWLERLVAPFDDPAVVAVGGTAQPRWSEPAAPPACLPRELLWVVGCSFTPVPDDEAAPATEVRNVMGCSMALRRLTALAVGGFSESMGRRGTLPLGCEETDLCIRLRQAEPAASVLMVPGAAVDHRVTAGRGTWGYLVRRCWSEGRSKAALSRQVGTDDGLSAERSYVASAIPRAVLRELAVAVRGGPEERARSRALGAAAALVLAVLVTAAGYGAGLVATLGAATWSAATGLRRGTALALLVLGLAACVAALAGAEGGARVAVTAVFLVLGPGWAVAGFLRNASVSLSWTVALAVGAAVGVLGGEAMGLLQAFHPVAALYLVAIVSAPLLLRHVVAVR